MESLESYKDAFHSSHTLGNACKSSHIFTASTTTVLFRETLIKPDWPSAECPRMLKPLSFAGCGGTNGVVPFRRNDIRDSFWHPGKKQPQILRVAQDDNFAG